MSTGVIVAIIVAVVVIVGALALVIRARRDQRQLNRRRVAAATDHREQADRRARHAEAAEHRARIAQAEAERHRAEAQLDNERAVAYEKGLADDELPSHEQDAGDRREGERETGEPVQPRQA